MAVYQDVLADVEIPGERVLEVGTRSDSQLPAGERLGRRENLARYSFLGSARGWFCIPKNRTVRRIGSAGESTCLLEPGQDPLDLLKAELTTERPLGLEGLPSFVGGAVGLMSYDIVRFFELGFLDTTKDDLNVDDMAMMLADTTVVFDHAKNIVRVLVMTDARARELRQRGHRDRLGSGQDFQALPPLPKGAYPVHPVESNVTQEQFEAMGDADEGVHHARRWDPNGSLATASRRKVDAHSLTVYRALCLHQPVALHVSASVW